MRPSTRDMLWSWNSLTEPPPMPDETLVGSAQPDKDEDARTHCTTSMCVPQSNLLGPLFTLLCLDVLTSPISKSSNPFGKQ